ncbi:hypothetical protein GCM10022403_060970 [Streptomyces coacervatus]|uniref:Cellulase n=1 Tax=Streptomyces coacervatus TaxID=647381 RepID=A0ABP7IID3_9ACTN|nr:hypothetical protein [Streptomyces coacervatus]MDF2269898.1 hypothetical protein [Streptomyces coacervatus]
MITHSDEGPDFDPDDPLTVILQPPAEYLGAPPGRYEEIRRGASRRRLLRAAAGAALTCGVAALVVLPLHLTTAGRPASPTVPLAPPPASSRSTTTPPSTTAPAPVTPSPSARPTTTPTRTPGTRTAEPSVTSVPSLVQSAAPTGGATPSRK